MKKLYAILIISICSFVLSAQTPTKYWVQFSNKGNTTFSFSQPSAYLSPRAIARRVAQNIPLDSLDIPVHAPYIAGVAAITGVSVHSVSKWLNGVVIFTSNPSVLSTIAALPYVTTVGNIGLRQDAPGNDKFVLEDFSTVDWSLNRTGNVATSTLNYGPSYNQINMLGGVCLHNSGFRGQGMQIAVIDAGFYDAINLPIFDSLYLNNRILGTWDFIMNDSLVYEDNAHGSMVLSTMGGNLDGQLIGTAPDASYWLLRSEDAPTENLVEEYYWSCAAEFADSVGADLINSSLGYNVYDDPSNNHTYADMDGHTTPCSRAANFAARKGIAVVVSAGNSGSSSWFYIGAPADADSAFTIAATDANGIVTGFSSRGSLSLFGNQKPDVGAQGQASVICDPFGVGIQTGNGTSFASPITCGLVACLWQAHPSFSNMQVLQTIQQSSNQYNSPDSLLGYGIPDFCAANLYLSGTASQFGTENQLYGIRPNPFSDNLNFSFYSIIDQHLDVRLFDAQGRELIHQSVFAVAEAVNNYTLIELATVSKGVYFLSVKLDDGIYFSSKVVKVE